MQIFVTELAYQMVAAVHSQSKMWLLFQKAFPLNQYKMLVYLAIYHLFPTCIWELGFQRIL